MGTAVAVAVETVAADTAGSDAVVAVAHELLTSRSLPLVPRRAFEEVDCSVVLLGADSSSYMLADLSNYLLPLVLSTPHLGPGWAAWERVRKRYYGNCRFGRLALVVVYMGEKACCRCSEGFATSLKWREDDVCVVWC